jgi:hypothetical protein
LLADFFEDAEDVVFPAWSDASRKETAFALAYTAKETDIIPDFIPEIGYADDSIIERTVLSRHQDIFRDYCRFRISCVAGGALSRRSVGGEWRHKHAATAVSNANVRQKARNSRRMCVEKAWGANLNCSKIIRRYADRDGERNIFDVESQKRV